MYDEYYLKKKPIKIQQQAIDHLIERYKPILNNDIYSVDPDPSKYYAQNFYRRTFDSLVSSSYMISRIPSEYETMIKKCEPVIEDLNELFEGAFVFKMAVENNYLVIKDRRLKHFEII
ncbi:hypothetical protein [Xylocopilactobacillus apis]|uniref:Uncharacterized protein n=1 Tax=Xylocopilactobacillus apis TaxID=2932183 RepID=A0AAU9DPH4_9LACO|nr:hypothetical protein [Xylocopilactobacillus apis]BDR56933.1 hypothetical protein KIMC2_14950 [Xylocopilactobacillus apis]